MGELRLKSGLLRQEAASLAVPASVEIERCTVSRVTVRLPQWLRTGFLQCLRFPSGGGAPEPESSASGGPAGARRY